MRVRCSTNVLFQNDIRRPAREIIRHGDRGDVTGRRQRWYFLYLFLSLSPLLFQYLSRILCCSPSLSLSLISLSLSVLKIEEMLRAAEKDGTFLSLLISVSLAFPISFSHSMSPSLFFPLCLSLILSAIKIYRRCYVPRTKVILSFSLSFFFYIQLERIHQV